MRQTNLIPHSIRAGVPGGSFLFAVALRERHRRLRTENLGALREAFRSLRDQRPYRIDASVILPDPLHCPWTLPPADADFSTRWRLIQASLSRAMVPGERLSSSRQAKRERGI